MHSNKDPAQPKINKSFIYLFFHLFLFIGVYLLYNIVVFFAIHWHESAMDLHVFPILITNKFFKREEIKSSVHHLKFPSPTSKLPKLGNSLAVQWLGHSTFIVGVQVPSLVRELRSHKLHDTAKEEKVPKSWLD